jgi:hypothetical protein
MEIRSQPVGSNPPERRIDITKPNRDSIKETLSELEAKPPVDAAGSDAALAKRIKNAREPEKLAKRIKNAREQAASQDGDSAERIQNARELAIQERIQNARAERRERIENARDLQQAAEAKRIHNAREQAKDAVDISFHVRRDGDEGRDALVQALKKLHASGELHTDDRTGRAADRMLSDD